MAFTVGRYIQVNTSHTNYEEVVKATLSLMNTIRVGERLYGQLDKLLNAYPDRSTWKVGVILPTEVNIDYRNVKLDALIRACTVYLDVLYNELENQSSLRSPIESMELALRELASFYEVVDVSIVRQDDSYNQMLVWGNDMIHKGEYFPSYV